MVLSFYSLSDDKRRKFLFKSFLFAIYHCHLYLKITQLKVSRIIYRSFMFKSIYKWKKKRKKKKRWIEFKLTSVLFISDEMNVYFFIFSTQSEREREKRRALNDKIRRSKKNEEYALTYASSNHSSNNFEKYEQFLAACAHMRMREIKSDTKSKSLKFGKMKRTSGNNANYSQSHCWHNFLSNHDMKNFW